MPSLEKMRPEVREARIESFRRAIKEHFAESEYHQYYNAECTERDGAQGCATDLHDRHYRIAWEVHAEFRRGELKVSI
jgi:hypothetical protein